MKKPWIFTDMIKCSTLPTRRLVTLSNGKMLTGRSNFRHARGGKIPGTMYEQPLSKFRGVQEGNNDRACWATWGD